MYIENIDIYYKERTFFYISLKNSGIPWTRDSENSGLHDYSTPWLLDSVTTGLCDYWTPWLRNSGILAFFFVAYENLYIWLLILWRHNTYMTWNYLFYIMEKFYDFFTFRPSDLITTLTYVLMDNFWVINELLLLKKISKNNNTSIKKTISFHL